MFDASPLPKCKSLGRGHASAQTHHVCKTKWWLVVVVVYCQGFHSGLLVSVVYVGWWCGLNRRRRSLRARRAREDAREPVVLIVPGRCWHWPPSVLRIRGLRLDVNRAFKGEVVVVVKYVVNMRQVFTMHTILLSKRGGAQITPCFAATKDIVAV